MELTILPVPWSPNTYTPTPVSFAPFSTKMLIIQNKERKRLFIMESIATWIGLHDLGQQGIR
jgi:hypothetical protein